MTEDEARDWLTDRFGCAALGDLDNYAALLRRAAAEQNLIAASTLPHLWARHIADSAQLLDHAPLPADGDWIDIGSGAGLPGLVIALLSDWPVTLVEPRKLRAQFLTDCISELNLSSKARVLAVKSASVAIPEPAAVISARAVAALPSLLDGCHHLADRDTLWLLPKGARAALEVADARRAWHGVFHVKPSRVDPVSGIVVASRIARR